MRGGSPGRVSRDKRSKKSQAFAGLGVVAVVAVLIFVPHWHTDSAPSPIPSSTPHVYSLGGSGHAAHHEQRTPRATEAAQSKKPAQRKTGDIDSELEDDVDDDAVAPPTEPLHNDSASSDASWVHDGNVTNDELDEPEGPTPAPDSLPSSWRCRSVLAPGDETDPHAPVTALNETLPAGHVCVVRNVCLDPTSGILSLFQDDASSSSGSGKGGDDDQRSSSGRRQAAEQRFQYPLSRQGRDNATVLHPNMTMLRSSVAAQRYMRGLSVLLRPPKCCGSIAASFEGIPTLQAAMHRLRRDKSFRRALGVVRSGAKLAIEVAGVVLATADHTAAVNRWLEWMIHFAVEGYNGDGGTAVKLGEIVDVSAGSLGAEPMCFESLLVPGAPGSFFPSKRAAFHFREELHKALSEEKKTLPDAESNWLASHERNGRFVKPPQRTILFQVRHPPRRALEDNGELLKVLERSASAVHAEVKSIDCNAHSFLSQAVHAQTTDVMVSVRGSDLINMIFMKPRRLVIEINPAFTYDPTVRNLAHILGLSHTAWTCTTPACAFGGDSAKWAEFVAASNMRYDTATRRITVGNAKPFEWPATGYVGSSCHMCARVATLPAFRARTLQESMIRLRSEAGQLMEFLSDKCFPRVGWIALGQGKPYRGGQQNG